MNNNLEKIRHSTSHLLAAAVMELYPDAKRTIGPSIDNGFYYDFDFGDIKITDSDLPKIEDKMREMLPSFTSFVKTELSLKDAKAQYKGNNYKLELIRELETQGEKTLTFYNSGDYSDLCKGPHIDNPQKELGFFKLLSVAGAYWRGSEKNKMLTRIYGTAFANKADLDEYLKNQEEALLRDHRKLGKELDLFTFSPLIGAGFPLYTPKGALIRRLLNEYVESVQIKEEYTQVWTPQVAKADLFKTSGHYDKYKDDMFRVVSNYSDEEFFLKPMNCPQHTQIYASKPRSYKDLPLRYTDFAMLYRDEKPGELSGLARVRSFSQDDCHIFCREDQVDAEIDKALTMTKEIMATFGFKYKYRLSTRDIKHPEKYLGIPSVWDKVEKWAVKIMERNGIEYFDGPGEAAFYAPKMDLIATDALGREWQLSTVQIDYVMPERFNLTYIDNNGKEVSPIMLHRAIIGSPERFMMILLEHLAGNLPTWLNPIQVKILPISEKHLEYAKTILNKLKENNIRAELDDRNETLGSKIRNANNEKASYMLIMGDREVEEKVVSIRSRSGKEIKSVLLDDFIKQIQEEIEGKTLN